MLVRSFTALALAVAVPSAVEASDTQQGLLVWFEESAPRDRLRVVNKTACDLTAFQLNFSLIGSAGSLIFDTTPGGAGVNVAQPFQIESGAQYVSATTPVGDGDEAVNLAFTLLPQDASTVFTMDVDDRLTSGPMGPTMVAGSEIAGARLTYSTPSLPPIEASLDETGAAIIPIMVCGPSV